MSESLYLSEVALLGVVMLWFTRRQWVMQLQILGWMFLVTVIMVRYGIEDQQNFYSNDQQYHVPLVKGILADGLPYDLGWWLSSVRLPYTAPATVLTAIGVEPLLSLKFVSLLALLATTSLIRRLVPDTSISGALVSLYLTATALIGTFFASLGLRETTMMFLVLMFFAGTSSVVKLSALTGLVLLRPHLAVAVLCGALIALVLRRIQRSSSSTPLTNFISIASAPLLGYFLYSVGLQLRSEVSGIYGHSWGISPVLRIASNYIGLQFLTVRESTVEFSITSLLLLRLVLSETVIIPLLFTILVLLAQRRSSLTQSVMWSFGIYVGIITNTDFNSFRQNIPFMPVMGLVVLLAWNEHRGSRSKVETLAVTAQRER